MALFIPSMIVFQPRAILYQRDIGLMVFIHLLVKILIIYLRFVKILQLDIFLNL